MKKLFSLFALCASFLYAEIYLVDGVDLEDESTYYDFDKVFDGSDDDLCWAYSAANVLQWWQDKQDDFYISLNSIPDGNTYDDVYASDIVSTFVYAWKDNDGGYEINGFRWWLTDVAGTALPQAGETGVFPEGGAYWSGLVSTTAYVGAEISIRYAAAEYKYEEYFMEVMNEAILGDCGMTLGIYTKDGGAHAITLWGYEEDEGDYWLYLTDSDDWKIGVYGMVRVQIEYNEAAQLWYLLDYYGTDVWYVGDITTLAVGLLTVPEPATSLLSLMALAGMLARRRR